jgi:hypothetical protein
VLLEGMELPKPRGVTGTEAGYQDQGFSFPLDFVEEPDPVYVGLWHFCTSADC